MKITLTAEDRERIADLMLAMADACIVPRFDWPGGQSHGVQLALETPGDSDFSLAAAAGLAVYRERKAAGEACLYPEGGDDITGAVEWCLEASARVREGTLL